MTNQEIIRKSNRRAYLIAFTGFLCFFTIYGTAYNCLGLFMKPMSEEFGVPRAVISSLFTVTALCGFIFIPIIGKIVDKMDLKPVLAAGCLCMSVSYFIFAAAPNVPVLYAGAVIESIGIGCTINMPVAFMIKSWFKSKQGLATGATIIGSGLGGAVNAQIVNAVISAMSWRAAYVVLGAIVLVLVIPFVLAFARKSPYSINMVMYGEYDQTEENVEEVPAEVMRLRDERADVKGFMKSKEFYLLFIGLFFMVLPTIGIKSHMVAHLTDLGYSPEISTTILTICLFASIPGAVGLGAIFDKAGSIFMCIFAGSLLALGCFMLASSGKGIGLAFIFGIIYGFAVMIQPVGVPLIFTDVLRTNTNFATIMSITGLGMSLGSAFGTLILGQIYDLTGSYVMGFVASGVSFLLGILLIVIALRISHKKHQEFMHQ